jgi:hypothetical protein
MRLAIILLIGIGVLSGQEAADMSGTWRLNIEKSSWGKHPKPSNGTISIEHREPSLKYSGQVAMGQGNETADQRSFQFNGTIDGKDYPVTGSPDQESASVRRVDRRTIESQRKGPDGKVIETGRTTISADGKRLTRSIKAMGPNGETSWTEVYDRQ